VAGGVLDGNPKHIIVVCRLDLSAAAQYHFGRDWWAENDDDNRDAFKWIVTNGNDKETFDGNCSLDHYVKYLTSGLPGIYGSKHLHRYKPHSWWVVHKDFDSLQCPNPKRCLMCSSLLQHKLAHLEPAGTPVVAVLPVVAGVVLPDIALSRRRCCM
jgi:hypothetical protein